MRQTYLCGVAIAAALGFAPPANAGMVNVPTIRPSLPKVTPPKITPPKVTVQTLKVTPQTPKVSGANAGTKVGRHGGHNPQSPTVMQNPLYTPQPRVTPTVTPPTATAQTPTVTTQTVTATVTPTGSMQTPTANLQTPSVAQTVAKQPTTANPGPINLQKATGPTENVWLFNSDSTVHITSQPTVTLNKNGPPTVTQQTVTTTTPTGSQTPTTNTQRTNASGMGPTQATGP